MNGQLLIYKTRHRDGYHAESIHTRFIYTGATFSPISGKSSYINYVPMVRQNSVAGLARSTGMCFVIENDVVFT